MEEAPGTQFKDPLDRKYPNSSERARFRPDLGTFDGRPLTELFVRPLDTLIPANRGRGRAKDPPFPLLEDGPGEGDTGEDDPAFMNRSRQVLPAASTVKLGSAPSLSERGRAPRGYPVGMR